MIGMEPIAPTCKTCIVIPNYSSWQLQVARQIEVVELWAFNKIRVMARCQTLQAQNLNAASLSCGPPILLDMKSNSN